ncbi:MAG TPA: hypothetical protein VKV04_03745 [Verrucomicrobiae bacterium]|nr:hypothetical protein [Verrucomicrobiae bacterium]
MANNLPTEKKVLVASMLAEGSSIRGIERVTGINRNTIMSLGVRIGTACERIHDEKMINLNCRRLEVDEVWGFIGKKRRFTTGNEREQGLGDVWTYIAIDADSKLIPCYHVGRRVIDDTEYFISDLAARMTYRIQLTSDSMASYGESVANAFGENVDYAQVVKTYSVVNLSQPASGRYSPADVVKVERKHISGSPDRFYVTTSHVEKQNHTLRMHCRRLTRLTNAFSKKLENFKAAVALNFAYYNLVKVNVAVKTTPAVAAGVETKAWTMAELVERCGE